MTKIMINSYEDLIKANIENAELSLTSDINNADQLTLAKGVKLFGNNHSITFKKKTDGFSLTQKNVINGLNITVEPKKRAIYFDNKNVASGLYKLQNLKINGLLNLIIKNNNNDVNLKLDNINIQNADATEMQERPEGYGVKVLQGALTILNAAETTEVKATLKHISVGSNNNPVFGSGVFVSGTERNATLKIDLLQTEEVYSNGKIKPGTADLITGGVFTVWNTFVNKVVNNKLVKTFGYNDMVLDNWGNVNTWIAKDRVESLGQSGIGFVNFGIINKLVIKKMIKTTGVGARGINNYDGTMNKVVLYGIETHGDGAIGIQVSKPMGSIVVKHNIETFGGTGQSLVKGVIKTLSAMDISILPGATLPSIKVKGDVIVHDKSLKNIENLGSVNNGIIVKGKTLVNN